ncbi:hypothetical protein KGF57_002676 [Candida theae]|uniref:Spindle pole body-associated protein Vik1/Cik1 microtubule binding domain-containing protein n=1 Tax=Candida theae TaxID=1198502 RepID=A0AAD5FYP4_9ASCO|nr:uncharacterized protein KGF57_002676 [Candida theae]KAI5958321.1 hypothetical protein KGF57_002676 [Candida theae]
MSKKRPLEEISQNTMCSPPKRRSSLGFEMASIPTTTTTPPPATTNEPNRNSKLPQPSTTKNSSTELTNENDFQSRILSIQERLSKKPPRTTSAAFEYGNSSSTPSSCGLNELQESLSSLHQECRDKHRKLEHLTEELSRLRRIHRNYQQKVETTTSEIDNACAWLEYMEEEIVKYVANEEKLIEIKLDENRMKLENQFTEIEFEMANEVQEVRNFDYNELVDKIDELKCAEVDLKEEIRVLSFDHEGRYNEEVDKLRQEFEIKTREIRQLEDESTAKLNKMKEELDKTSKEYQSQLSVLEVHVQRVDKLKSEITNIEETMNNYTHLRREAEVELSQLKQTLMEKTSRDKLEQMEFDTVQLEYSNLRDKISNHDEHRRILENSIMEYRGKMRVYAITNDLEHKIIFNKVFASDAPASFIIDEFSHLVKSLTRGNNVGIISQHLRGSTIILQTIQQLESYRAQSTSWQFEFNYQAMSCNSCVDLLNNSLPFAQSNLFESQKMRIDDPQQVSSIINGFNTNKTDVVVHVITVNGIKKNKGFESRLVVIDVTDVGCEEQMTILSKLIRNDKVTYLDRVLDWVSSKSAPLVISKVTDSSTLSVLKTINSTAVNCKKAVHTM